MTECDIKGHELPSIRTYFPERYEWEFRCPKCGAFVNTAKDSEKLNEKAKD